MTAYLIPGAGVVEVPTAGNRVLIPGAGVVELIGDISVTATKQSLVLTTYPATIGYTASAAEAVEQNTRGYLTADDRRVMAIRAGDEHLVEIIEEILRKIA